MKVSGRNRSSPVIVLLTAMWVFVILWYLVPLVLFLPLTFIPRVGYTWYRRICGYCELWAVPAVMCIPFSWCSSTLHIQNYAGFQQLKSQGNSLLLSTHCSRIDWLIGEYLGMLGDRAVRVNFVAEMTIGLLPIIGWTRVLFGDILVMRAFHKDGPRIQANIEGFHASGVERLIFLAPEGFIADPGCAVGDKYIRDCEAFMADLGLARLTHVLTPRYKGMQVFVKHAPGNVGSCAMSFVEGYPTLDPATGAWRGGDPATLSLATPGRRSTHAPRRPTARWLATRRVRRCCSSASSASSATRSGRTRLKGQGRQSAAAGDDSARDGKY